MKDVTRALQEFIGVFDQLGITYAVIGGIAVRAYGIPRATYDVDFTLAVSQERLLNLFQAVEEKGYTIPDQYKSDWVDRVAGMPVVKARAYLEGHEVDVDLFLAESPYQNEILKRRQFADTIDGEMWLASPEDIILLKMLAFRDRDKSDIADVLFAQGQLDEEYMRHWAKKFHVLPELEQALINAQS